MQLLTVVVHDVNGVLVFGEADGPAAGQAQQRHQGTEHWEPHGWGQVTALLNYLPTGHSGEGTPAPLPAAQQGFRLDFSTGSRGH